MRTFVSELQSFICPDEPAGKIVVDYRDVGTGGQREQCLSPYFDRSVNLISTQGGGGVYIMPIPLLLAPPLLRIFRPSYGPGLEYVVEESQKHLPKLPRFQRGWLIKLTRKVPFSPLHMLSLLIVIFQKMYPSKNVITAL